MSNVFVFRRPPHGVITEYFGGGKGGSTTTTNNVTQIPPEVLARYNAVNARAEAVAQAPYQAYSQDPNAFVAPLSQTQQAGIQNTNAMAGAAQPYYGAATGLAAQSTGSVNPSGLNVGQYMNPYTQSVVNATQAAMNQQQGQQLSQQQADAIRGGAFGGDRAGLQRAQLMGQQSLAQAQAIAPLYQQNYNQALAAAQQQQGVGLGAEQANRQNLQNAAQLFGSIGTNAQQAGLAGAQAQLAAGQQQQQTQQAGLQALYNQFQQQQGFPYQQAQFLANIATGTGALSGNAASGTSTTTGGGGFFSDERLKENIKKVGETDDGQPIYRYNYKGDQRTQIGLLAQDVEKDHPEAVGSSQGYKTVDYKKATEGAIHKEDGGALSGTDAYSIGAPSAMLRENSGKGLGAMPSLPQAFQGGRDIPIEAGARNPMMAGLRTPEVKGVNPESRVGAQAELDSLLSAQNQPPGPNGALLGSGPGYIQTRIGTLQDWLNKNASPGPQYSSAGGLVGPEGGAFAHGGSFARGGLAEGGYMNPALAYYSPQQAQGGLYGAQLQPLAQRQILQGTPMQAPQQRQQPDAVTSAMNMAKLVQTGNEAYKARPDFLRSAADVAERNDKKLYDKKVREEFLLKHGIEPTKVADNADSGGDDSFEGGDEFARGGYAGRGYVNPYGGLGGNDILGPIIEEQDTSRRLSNDKVTPPPQPKQQSSGLGELAQMANTGKSLYKGGEYVAGKLGLGAPETAMSATSAEALPGVIDLTSGAGLTGAAEGAGIAAAAPEALSAGLAGGEALAGGAAAAEGVAAAAAAAEAAAAAAAAAEVAAGAEAALAFLPFLSDERAKHDIKKVGTLFDGQPVYRFKYNGDDKTQMGLIAQKVEKSAPEAVGLAGGMKTVDYHRATNAAAKRGHFDEGGFLVPEDYVTDADFTPPPGLAGAEGGNETAQTGGDGGETRVPRAGLAPPIARPASRVPGPEDAIVATTPATAKPRPGLEPPKPSKPFLPEITSKDVKDTLSSENFWVPALAGLGSMLASPNKTLAGAIGSGLVGGTGAYSGLQKQQSEIAKNSLDIFNKVFEKREDGEGNVSYMNLQTGQPATPQEAFGFLRNMPGFSGLAKAPTSSVKEAPQRDATVALANDVVGKGVEPVTPRVAATSSGAGAAKPTSTAAADTVAAAGAPSTTSVPSVPPVPAVAKPKEGEQPGIRISQEAQAEILKADAWARSQPDVKDQLAEAELQSRIADRAQAAMRKPVTPEIRANLAKQFELANTQAREARSRAEAAVTRLTAPIYTDISRQLGVSPEAVAGAARMKAGEAMAVLDPDIVRRQAEAAALKTRAVKGAESESELVEVMRPDGSTAYVPKAKVLAGDKPVTPGAGSPTGEVSNNTTPDNVKSLPAATLKMKEDISKDELKMSDNYLTRQVAQSRVRGLLDILTQYETGKFAEQKADIVGKLRGLGIDVKDTDSASPGKLEIFMKGAIKNVFDDLPGGKILLAEISGLSKANANAPMQPEANAKILGDALATAKYEDKYVLDYAKWRQENPNAYSPMDTIQFNEEWLRGNNLDAFKKETARHIGYLGQRLPAKFDDAVHGQRYYLPETKELRYFDKTLQKPDGSKGAYVKTDPLAGGAAQ